MLKITKTLVRIHNVGCWEETRDSLCLTHTFYSVLLQPSFKSLNEPDKHGPCWRWQINEAPLPGSFVLVIRLSQWRAQSWVPGSCTQNPYEPSCPEGRGWRSPHQRRFTSACEPRRLGLNRTSGTIPACTGWHSVALCFWNWSGTFVCWNKQLVILVSLCSLCVLIDFSINPWMHKLSWYKINNIAHAH